MKLRRRHRDFPSPPLIHMHSVSISCPRVVYSLPLMNLHWHSTITLQSLHYSSSWKCTFYGLGHRANGKYPSLRCCTEYFHYSKNLLFHIFIPPPTLQLLATTAKKDLEELVRIFVQTTSKTISEVSCSFF